MHPRAIALSLAALFALGIRVVAQPQTHWRSFNKLDGLPENACSSVSIGGGGNILIRHVRNPDITLFNGYRFTTVPATNRNRIHESPGGQLWTVSAEGLQEFRDGEWTLHRVAQIAGHFRAGHTNEISLLPFRQGRVFILLPGQLLQLDAEDTENVRVELFRHAEDTTIGDFLKITPTRDGGAWISGTHGYARLTAPLRNLKPTDPWATTNAAPAELQPDPADKISSDDISVRRIYDQEQAADGTLFLATSDGLFRRTSEIWQPTASPPQARPPGKITLPEDIRTIATWRVIYTTRTGDLWLGGDNHVAQRHQDKWRVFASTNQLGPEHVTAFAETADGRMWCATPNKIWEFNGRDWLAARGGFEHINELLGARDGTLWIATAHGLHRFTQDNWISNGTEDGLPSNEIIAVAEDASGVIHAQTTAGWSRFQPEADRDAPETLIQSSGNAPLHFREGAIVRLTFHGRDKWKQTIPERLLFSYRLDEREWSPFQPEREVMFTELALGRHYFQVRAMDRCGNIDPGPAQLEFAILLPWYRETRLVVVLATALVIAVFFAGLAFNRHRKLQRSYAEVERQVTERTRELELANRELLHSQKMNALGTLSAGIAHDFNNILSIIKGSAQIIEDNADNPEKIRTRTDRIKTVVQQGAEVVEAMLGFSRSTDAPPAPCDINAVVADTRKLLGDRFLRETEVRFERGENLPEISVARDFVQQILLNFIFNAAEAMDRRIPQVSAQRHNQIILSTRAATTLPAELFLAPAAAVHFILISVCDNGSGIAPEIKSRIFEPFFTTKAMSAKRGTGLGLSMAYELAKKLGAGLAVESTAGQGSTFTLILPIRSP